MRRLRTLPLMLSFLAVVGLGLTACAGPEPLTVAANTVIVDVRTPGEYSAGHLDGAVNVNLQSGSFEQEIAEYPVDGDYIVYCQSGNRSAQAVSIMESAGFSNVHDAGAIQSAADATGIPIVAGN
ncbi:rhodanese-like domain-containing protein [Cryobacterium psychrophilum]|uniref:Rhodanese-like domain-containing protein n=1 Tax=Cryobacterium psychrophilum TaxID=41988 RepID=A0A4Y8KT88_9MICO|nr:rhodanese-like domain-containing protein [Cryobacterium psychrophilum]TDW28722.1 rhodanese-like domain-containing protein [Cryobacterium psychrophilum]TFD82382.1 rhodanese-like domain-containing protein [Cryobacterium psychrophilum]